MPKNSANDRYVTWSLRVPEGVAVPSLDRWSLPVMFPDPQTFFPKSANVMYAIRNPSASQVFTTTGQALPAPAGAWFIFTDGSGYGMVADEYFSGGTPDPSDGLVYPPEEVRHLPANPPEWARNGTKPPNWHPPKGPVSEPAPKKPSKGFDTPKENP